MRLSAKLRLWKCIIESKQIYYKGGIKVSNIKQRLLALEKLSKQDGKYMLNPIIYFETQPNGDIYKIRDSDLEYCKNIKNADKLEFKNEQECKEWLDNNIDLLDIPSIYDSARNKVRFHYQMLKIVDNSHLEKVLYEYNRQ